MVSERQARADIVTSEDGRYLPIENYGVIGDLRTTALIGVNGSIDWFCYPRIDSPSVFGRLLDADKGGFFQIHPATDGMHWRQQYWPETNVLVTRFFSDDGMVEIIDFMPLGTDVEDTISDEHSIVRLVQVLRGAITLDVVCEPAMDYARAGHEVEIVEQGAIFHGTGSAEGQVLRLASTVPLEADGRRATGRFRLSEGESAGFSFQGYEADGTTPMWMSPADAHVAFERTITWWRTWLKSNTYRGRWREEVVRSALTLKLLSHENNGSIAAAATTSLPEVMGGERNWDYRYAWVRDSAFVVYALIRIGFKDEARQFISWLSSRCNHTDASGPIQLMYRVDGAEEFPEIELDHLEGYRGSRPVRVGNAAVHQLQLDIYGELMDAVYLSNKYDEPISWELWQHLSGMVDWVVDNWREKDSGLWESRGGLQHYTMAKVMCWVAIDRAIRIATKRSFPAPLARWISTRDDIYNEVMEKAWSEKRQAFTQYYGSDELDASVLLMPLVFFVAPNEPKMLKTIDAIMQSPVKGGLSAAGLVYRYRPGEEDGLEGEEGTFSMCTFWLVEALTRAGRVDEARLIFERMLGFANHLGLYSEEIGLHGEALGNTPQGFTHFALISAAFNLDRALG
ncbi:MAG TPA: glycoside hydrolase family 15 protein [Thermomicrobiales bacterium]|nr:glycoside hydrolase family 15 protein [Thermomicrobiales bacterium]